MPWGTLPVVTATVNFLTASLVISWDLMHATIDCLRALAAALRRGPV
jgi:hypothetical protein